MWEIRLLLQWQVCIDRGKGLALWRPVGKKLHNPGHAAVLLQLLLWMSQGQKRQFRSLVNLIWMIRAQNSLWCLTLHSKGKYGIMLFSGNTHIYSLVIEVLDVLRAHIEWWLTGHEKHWGRETEWHAHNINCSIWSSHGQIGSIEMPSRWGHLE